MATTENIEVEISIDKKQVDKEFNNLRDNIKGFKKRLASDEASKLALSVSLKEQELRKARGLLRKAIKDENSKAEIKIRTNITKLQQGLTGAKRELRNFVRTGEKDVSVLGKLFNNVTSEIEKSRAELIKIWKSTKWLDKIETKLNDLDRDFKSGKISVQQYWKSVSKLEWQAKKAWTQTSFLWNSIKQIWITFWALFAINKIGDFIGSIVRLWSNLQQTTIAFESLLWSTEKADKLLRDLTNFAKNTPFEIVWIRNTAKQLLAFWFSQEKIIPTLKRLWDVSAWLSVPIEQIALAYWQVRTANQLYWTELRQFVWAWVPLLWQLAKQFNKTEAEVKKMVESWKVWFDDVEQAFTDMTSEWWLFFDLMDAQSKTVAWRFSNLKDTVTDLAERFWTKLLPALEKIIDWLNGVIDFTIKYWGALKNLWIAIASLLTAKALFWLASILRKLPALLWATTVATWAQTTATWLLNIALVRLRVIALSLLWPFALLTWAIFWAVKAYDALADAEELFRQWNENTESVLKAWDKAIKNREDNIKRLAEENKKLAKSDDVNAKAQIEINRKRILSEIKLQEALRLNKFDPTWKRTNDLLKEWIKLRNEANEAEKKLQKTQGNITPTQTIKTLNSELKKLQDELWNAIIWSKEFDKIQKNILTTQEEITKATSWWVGGWKSNVDKAKKEAEKLLKIEKDRIQKTAEQDLKFFKFQQKREDERIERAKKTAEKEVELAETAQEQIDDAVKESEKNIKDYQKEIEKTGESFDKLKEKATEDIAKIDEELGKLGAKSTTDVADRILEINDRIEELKKAWITDPIFDKKTLEQFVKDDVIIAGWSKVEAKNLLELLNLQEELKLAKENTTEEAIEEAQRQEWLSPTALILEEIEAEKKKLEAKKLTIETELLLAEEQKNKEIEILGAKITAEKTLIEELWDIRIKTEEFVTKRLDEETKKQIALTEKVIAKTKELIELKRKAGLSGGDVSTPEVPTTWSNWNNTNTNNVNVNIGWVTVTNEADENRLVDKIKKSIITDSDNANKWIF